MEIPNYEHKAGRHAWRIYGETLAISRLPELNHNLEEVASSSAVMHTGCACSMLSCEGLRRKVGSLQVSLEVDEAQALVQGLGSRAESTKSYFLLTSPDPSVLPEAFQIILVS